MATVIIAKNLTAGDLPLLRLSVTDSKIPASGQVNLTDYNRVWEIQEDLQLRQYIANDQVILNNGLEDLTKEESQNYSSPVASETDPQFRSTTDTGGGSGNAGYLLALDANGKADGRDVGADGSTLDNHVGSTSNPHSVTKTQVGLTNVTDDAQLKRAAGDINSFTAKTTPATADLLLIEDSEDSNNKKKVTVGGLKTTIMGGTRVRTINALREQNEPYIRHGASETDYFLMQHFQFLGSTIEGTPSALKALVALKTVSGKTCQVKIYDRTNSKTIAESVALSFTTKEVFEIKDLGTLSNIPTGPAVWEVHMRGTYEFWYTELAIVF